MDETKHRHICDCGEVYWSLAAIESCQMNNHGRPKTEKSQVIAALVMDETNHTPWTISKPGFGKVAATIPIIYDALCHAVAHVLGGQDKAQLICQAVNSYASNQAQIAALREALECFVAAEKEYREEILSHTPDAYDDPLQEAYDKACAALALGKER